MELQKSGVWLFQRREYSKQAWMQQDSSSNTWGAGPNMCSHSGATVRGTYHQGLKICILIQILKLFQNIGEDFFFEMLDSCKLRINKWKTSIRTCFFCNLDTPHYWNWCWIRPLELEALTIFEKEVNYFIMILRNISWNS